MYYKLYKNETACKTISKHSSPNNIQFLALYNDLGEMYIVIGD